MTNNSNKQNNKNSIRIIAGKWRSRKLTFPSGIESLRPTPDRIRETVFNWLQQKINGANCLDLFAGSGAFSFEACSRGANSIVAVDSSAQVTDVLQENCHMLACNQIKVMLAESRQWLQQKIQQEQFDIIFLDPPYNDNLLAECCHLLVTANLVAPGCIIYLEANHSLEDIILPESWHLLKMKKAGQIYYGICENVAS